MCCFDLSGLADTSTTLNTIQGVCNLRIKNVGHEVLRICFYLSGVVMAMVTERIVSDLISDSSCKNDQSKGTKLSLYLSIDKRILVKILSEL